MLKIPMHQFLTRVGGILGDYKKVPLVVGATGIVGRNLLKHLVALEGWDLVALSRWPPDVEVNYRHTPINLLDRNRCSEKLADLCEVTHIFFAAYIEKATLTAPVRLNVDLLRNLLDVVELASDRPQHMHLMQDLSATGII